MSSLLPRKGLLAIAAVIDVALHARGQPVAAKSLAARHRLPPRHLETLLQALVREGVLKGVRGPRGGYELAREPRRITAQEILRAVGTMEETGNGAIHKSALMADVVMPALTQAEVVFSGALGHINFADLVAAARDAETDGVSRRARPVPTAQPIFCSFFSASSHGHCPGISV